MEGQCENKEGDFNQAHVLRYMRRTHITEVEV